MSHVPATPRERIELEPIGYEEALEMSRGEDREAIREHGGVFYLVHRSPEGHATEGTEVVKIKQECGLRGGQYIEKRKEQT